MDAILPIVFALAFFIFQGYLNYKKEQEKAKKRNPGKAPQPVVPSNKPVQSETSWFEELLLPTPDQQVPHQTIEPIRTAPPVVESKGTGQEKYIPEKYQQVRYQPSEIPPDLLKEYRNLPEKREMEEVKKSKILRKAHQNELNRLSSLLIEEEQANDDFPEFNFRDAIVMNAILERPYQ